MNVYEHEILKNTVWLWTTLKSGDCIYIPANYLHQFRSYGRSISTSIYFSKIQQLKSDMSKMKSEEFSKCSQDAPSFETMNGFKKSFFWTYTHGERHLNNRNFQTPDTRNILKYLMREDRVLHFSRFKSFLKEITKELNENDVLNQRPDKLWKDFFLHNKSSIKNFLSIEQVYNLNTDNLRRFTVIVNTMASAHDRKFKNEL